MSYTLEFKQKAFEGRQKCSNKLISKFPDRIPVIVDKVIDSPIAGLTKHKYLVPIDITVAFFICEIRKHVKIRPEESIYLMCENTLLNSSCTVASVYNKYKDDDGFLYITYASENVFG